MIPIQNFKGEQKMKKTVQLYEGKAKKVFATEDPNLVIGR